ncbi:MAG: NlpC/P60 family protein [Sulfitobacter sp.]
MSDRRITPDPTFMTKSDEAQIVTPIADLCRAPSGPRDRQLIFGDTVVVLNDDAGWSYVQSDKDKYCGFVRSDQLDVQHVATHKITAPATHVYQRADFKSSDLNSLSFGSQIRVTAQTKKFAETNLGFVPLPHLAEMTAYESDPAKVAALFLGTPYLWGGNSRWGIDCSGLVQAALLACHIPCPGDSDQQQRLGEPANGAYHRNDLLFWKGHVALVTDADTLIHANAHSMSVTYEPIHAAIKRIQDNGDGPVTAHRRL